VNYSFLLFVKEERDFVSQMSSKAMCIAGILLTQLQLVIFLCLSIPRTPAFDIYDIIIISSISFVFAFYLLLLYTIIRAHKCATSARLATHLILFELFFTILGIGLCFFLVVKEEMGYVKNGPNRTFYSVEQMLIVAGVFVLGLISVTVSCMAHRVVLMRKLLLSREERRYGRKDDRSWESKDEETKVEKQ
jgi:hypothetical protein